MARVDDAEAKTAAAREAVARLKAVVQPYEKALAEQEGARANIAAARTEQAERRATARRLAELKDRYMEILQMDPQRRGFALEPFLRQLFEVFHLDPKASFRVTGEQIDGVLP